MAYKTDKSILRDEILRLATVSTLTAAMIIAPNSITLFNKRVQSYLKKMDENKREREYRDALRQLRQQKLITEDYEFGIRTTKKAEVRLEKRRIKELTLPTRVSWDGRWRMIFFDIPEKHKAQRDAFAAHITALGFKVLQRSVFVYPFDSRKQVEDITNYYSVGKYVSYVEAEYIDNQDALINKLKSVM